MPYITDDELASLQNAVASLQQIELKRSVEASEVGRATFKRGLYRQFRLADAREHASRIRRRLSQIIDAIEARANSPQKQRNR